MKLRLLVRKGIADADGRCVGYDYLTEIIEVNEKSLIVNGEVIGGEWVKDEIDGRDCLTCDYKDSCNLVDKFLISPTFERPNYCSEYKRME